MAGIFPFLGSVWSLLGGGIGRRASFYGLSAVVGCGGGVRVVVVHLFFPVQPDGTGCSCGGDGLDWELVLEQTFFCPVAGRSYVLGR